VSESACTLDCTICSVHGVIHGAEAAEFRERISTLIVVNKAELNPEYVLIYVLERLLEEIDDRDSAAWRKAHGWMKPSAEIP
jgi:hypothetical protein